GALPSGAVGALIGLGELPLLPLLVAGTIVGVVTFPLVPIVMVVAYRRLGAAKVVAPVAVGAAPVPVAPSTPGMPALALPSTWAIPAPGVGTRGRALASLVIILIVGSIAASSWAVSVMSTRLAALPPDAVPPGAVEFGTSGNVEACEIDRARSAFDPGEGI